MKNIKPFGPSIGKTKLSKKFINVLNKEFDEKSKNKKIDCLILDKFYLKNKKINEIKLNKYFYTVRKRSEFKKYSKENNLIFENI